MIFHRDALENEKLVLKRSILGERERERERDCIVLREREREIVPKLTLPRTPICTDLKISVINNRLTALATFPLE